MTAGGPILVIDRIDEPARPGVPRGERRIVDDRVAVRGIAAHREDAGLNCDIVIAGTTDKIEVWDRKEWDAVLDLTKEDKKAVAAKLTSYGI